MKELQDSQFDTNNFALEGLCLCGDDDDVWKSYCVPASLCGEWWRLRQITRPTSECVSGLGLAWEHEYLAVPRKLPENSKASLRMTNFNWVEKRTNLWRHSTKMRDHLTVIVDIWSSTVQCTMYSVAILSNCTILSECWFRTPRECRWKIDKCHGCAISHRWWQPSLEEHGASQVSQKDLPSKYFKDLRSQWSHRKITTRMYAFKVIGKDGRNLSFSISLHSQPSLSDQCERWLPYQGHLRLAYCSWAVQLHAR